MVYMEAVRSVRSDLKYGIVWEIKTSIIQRENTLILGIHTHRDKLLTRVILAK